MLPSNWRFPNQDPINGCLMGVVVKGQFILVSKEEIPKFKLKYHEMHKESPTINVSPNSISIPFE